MPADDAALSRAGEPSPAAVGELVRLLRKLLPPLQVRIRAGRLESLARRIAKISDPSEFAGTDRPGLRYASLAVLTIRVVGQLQIELAEVERRIAAHVDAYARADNDDQRRTRLELMIDETAPDARSAREDRQALRRHLDLDALRERYDAEREQLAVAIELGIMFVGPAVERALASEHWDRNSSFVDNPAIGILSEVRTILEQAEPATFLTGQLALLRRWPTRLACIESLELVLMTHGMPVGASDRGHRSESPPRALGDVRATLLEVARDRSDHEWVQARAIACLRQIDADAWRSCVRERLGLDADEPPQWPTRDFLVRGLIIDQLGAGLEQAIEVDVELVREAVVRGDPSEFVRIAHAKLLEPLGHARPDLFVELAPILTRVVGEPGGERREPPRVHATACMAAVRAAVGVAVGVAAGGPGDEPAKLDPPIHAALIELVVARLAATIATVEHPLVARIACEQAAALSGSLRDAPRLADHARILIDALHRCLADPTRSAAVHEAAAAAVEDIDCALRRDRAAWTAALRAAVDAVPSGGARTVPVPEHDGRRPDRDELTRIAAALTRNDWGLDLDERRGKLLVRRGDRRVSRLWRLIHELRNPAGNKRQAFRHTTGRRYAGRLRAHPGRLDEVTATVVPGERLHIDAEGGWGRHLPLVDDVLGLPWLRGGRAGERPDVELGSTHGVTRMRLRGRLARRLWSRARLNLRYVELSELRRRALRADEPSERRRYADELRERYGVELEFRPHPSPWAERPVPPLLRALFPARTSPPAPDRPDSNAGAEASASASEPSSAHASLVPLPVPLAAMPELRALVYEWIDDNLHYFLTLEGNSQEALGYYALALAALFLGSGWWRRRKIAAARAAIPLSIGGWGTRGKSGTERLKAGLFHGLGFRTFSKTTGCEAMFIHAAPLGPQVEVFTFRPYNKATIWEQRGLLELAAGLGSEVFLWECMALNPEYVDILQRGWMRDDFATITNTYPDHEDIQGPAGIDVATVIGNFVPHSNLVISSELAFNPVLRDAAAARGAELIEIGDHEGDLLPDDLLALFPYAEHPRNIALVTELARQLGIDDELAIVTMADYVYPDLGVLKFYPEVRVRGRTLAFVNGCSANERAGFLNNWNRTGCVELAAAADPAKMVITVVNNRDDRVSRSEVFSRILVNDVSVDAHVLIGTNLAGLQIFIDRALETFAAEIELVDAEALASGEAGPARARARLRSLLRRVRAPVDDWAEQLFVLLTLGLAALGRRFESASAEAEAVRARVESLREAADKTREFDAVLANVTGDKPLDAAVRALVERAPEAPALVDPHELGRAADLDDLRRHLHDRVARMIVAARLSARLEPVLESRDAAALARFTAALGKVWSALFRGQVIVVEDAGATGDQIIDQCARAVPPGVHVTIMGTQNIKGTGLDFIYRWLAIDAVTTGLAKLDSDDEHVRLDALRSLDAHSDFGFCDTGLLVRRLPACTRGGAQEASLRQALIDKAGRIHRDKLAKLDSSASGAAAKGGRFWTWIEGWIDFVDGAVRYRQSRQLVDDLINFRVSHNKMAVEMRDIYGRAKGGWLGKALAARLPGRRARRSVVVETPVD